MSRPSPRILVLSYRHVGDVMFTTPALRALRRTFPEAHIAVVVGEQAAPLLEGSPSVSELIVLPRPSLRHKWRVRRLLRAGRYDTGILFQHTFANALLLCWLGCRRRAGLAWKGCGPLLTHRTPYVAGRHEADRYLAIVGTLGARGDGGGLEVTLGPNDRAWADRFLADAEARGLLVAVFPGSSPEWAIKRWPAERFAAAADAIARETGARILLLGGPGDRETADRVASAMRTAPINAVGSTSLKQLGALLERCSLLVSNDTGPMHLATAVGTPVVDLVGPGDPRKTGPYGPGHVVIQKVAPGSPKAWRPDHGDPMAGIAVEEVVEAALRLLASPPAHRSRSCGSGQGV